MKSCMPSQMDQTSLLSPPQFFYSSMLIIQVNLRHFNEVYNLTLDHRISFFPFLPFFKLILGQLKVSLG